MSRSRRGRRGQPWKNAEGTCLVEREKRVVREVLFTAPDVVEVRSAEDVPPGRGEVKVKTLLSGISHGTELNLLRGTAPGFHRRWNSLDRIFEDATPHKRYPVAPGYESVAVVVSLGLGVHGISLGSLVWLDRPHKTGHVIPAAEARAGLLSPSMTPERGIFCALARVALGAVHDAAIKVGDRVAVVGLGAIGLLCVQLARMNGALDVFALDRAPRRLKMAERFGAIPVEISHQRSGRSHSGADVVLETSGQYRGLQLAIACCAVGGSVVTVSSYQGTGRDLNLGEEYQRNRIALLSSMTVNGAPHRCHPHWDLARLNETARRLLSEGSLIVEPLITHVFSLEDAPCAYQLISRSPEECIRVALSPNGNTVSSATDFPAREAGLGECSVAGRSTCPSSPASGDR